MAPEIPGEGKKWLPTQYFSLGNHGADRATWATVHGGVAKKADKTQSTVKQYIMITFLYFFPLCKLLQPPQNLQNVYKEILTDRRQRLTQSFSQFDWEMVIYGSFIFQLWEELCMINRMPSYKHWLLVWRSSSCAHFHLMETHPSLQTGADSHN